MAAQVVDLDSITTATVWCVDPRCFDTATKVVIEDGKAYAMCTDHAEYYVDMAAGLEAGDDAERALTAKLAQEAQQAAR